MSKDVEDLKEDYKQHNCIELWDEIWEQPWMKYDVVVNEIYKKFSNLQKCDDLTYTEKKFIEMVGKWE